MAAAGGAWTRPGTRMRRLRLGEAIMRSLVERDVDAHIGVPAQKAENFGLAEIRALRRYYL